MGKSQKKTVLFLCTSNYYRSRFAEILFNSIAGNLGLPWTACSRGLAIDQGPKDAGPMAKPAIEALKEKGLGTSKELQRSPVAVSKEDFEKADWIVALSEAEHLPLITTRFPQWTERVEFWEVGDTPELFALIEAEAMGLAARLIAGGKKREGPVEITRPEPEPEKQKKKGTVRVGRETKGRRGKGVTTVFDVPLDDSELSELAATLKKRCGTGGTVKDGRIEIQGDQRDRLVAILEDLGFKVKRSGG